VLFYKKIFGMKKSPLQQAFWNEVIIERCERHDHACMGLTEGAMIGTEAGDMLTAYCKELTHHC